MNAPTTTGSALQRLLLSVDEAASVLGIGRTKLYELIAAGELRPVHIGRLCRLPIEQVVSFVQRLQSCEDA